MIRTVTCATAAACSGATMIASPVAHSAQSAGNDPLPLLITKYSWISNVFSDLRDFVTTFLRNLSLTVHSLVYFPTGDKMIGRFTYKSFRIGVTERRTIKPGTLSCPLKFLVKALGKLLVKTYGTL
jgi:hypothetical protein